MHAHLTPSEDCLKSQAHKLQATLKVKGAPLKYMDCLETVAALYGHKSWPAAQAHCKQHAAPLDRATQQEQDVNTAVEQALRAHSAYFLQALTALLQGRHAPKLFHEAGFVSDDESEGRYVAVGAKAILADNTKVELQAYVTFGNDFGILCLEPTFHFVIERDGTGPVDLLGRQEGEILWDGMMGAHDIEIDMHGFNWKTEVLDVFKRMPVRELFAEAIEQVGEVAELQKLLAAPIAGQSAEGLTFEESVSG